MCKFKWRKQVLSEDWPLLLEADPSKGMVEIYLEQSDILEVREQKELIGILVLKSNDIQTSEIMNLSVREDCRQKGIGRKLIEQALAFGRTKNDRKIMIATGTTSLSALLLYQKCGFRVEAVERDYFIQHYAEILIENGVVLRDRLILSQEI